MLRCFLPALDLYKAKENNAEMFLVGIGFKKTKEKQCRK